MFAVDHADKAVLDRDIDPRRPLGEIIRAVVIRATIWSSGMWKSRISRGGMGAAAGLDPSGPVQQGHAVTRPGQILGGGGARGGLRPRQRHRTWSFSRHHGGRAPAIHDPRRHQGGDDEQGGLGGEDRAEGLRIGQDQPQQVDRSRAGQPAENRRRSPGPRPTGPCGCLRAGPDPWPASAIIAPIAATANIPLKKPSVTTTGTNRAAAPGLAHHRDRRQRRRRAHGSRPRPNAARRRSAGRSRRCRRSACPGRPPPFWAPDSWVDWPGL